MAWIAYMGDHPEVSVFGLTFRGHAAVEVAEDSHAYFKLSRNGDFRVIAGEAPAVAVPAEVAREAVEPAPKRRGRPPKAR